MRCVSIARGRPMPRADRAVTGAVLLALAGCQTAPDYARPKLATPEAYKEAAGWQTAGVAVPEAGRWWEVFGDTTLNDLAGRIEAGNQDLAAAAARYAQAGALVRAARADWLPQIDASGAASRERLGQNRPLSQGRAVEYNDYVVGASLSYELDLFGRIRNSVRASTADAAASAADLAAVRLGLQAQLVSIYFDMRYLDARIALLRQTVDAFGKAYGLTDTRHEGGIASGIDVSRAKAQLSSARAELSSVMIDRQRDEHAIAVLLGEAPAGFSIPVVDHQVAPPAIPAGLPSTLLERRPDIAAAERRVAAANARIGVARAAMFPQVTLGAGGGFETTGKALLAASSGFWALGPISAALSVFDGGRRRAEVRRSRAVFDETAANYRQTVLTAFREVEDGLAAQRFLATQEKDQGEAASAAQRTSDLALTRYRDGAADYLEVTTAQTAALDAARALLDVRNRQLQAATDTARALGGVY